MLVVTILLVVFFMIASAIESPELVNADRESHSKGTHMHMETMQSFPWITHVKRADPDLMHEVVIAIKPLNMDYLEQSLIERSTPGNKLFQQWLTFDQVGQLTVNREGFNAVQNWLLSENVTITWVHDYYDYIKATTRLSVWERLLNAEFHEWTHSNRKTMNVVRSNSYGLPHAIAPYVSAMFNTVQFPPRVQKHFAARAVPEGKQLYKTDMVFHDSNLRTPKGSTTINLETQTTSNLVSVTFLDNYYQIPTNIGDPSLQQVVFATAQSTGTAKAGNYFSQSDLNISLSHLGVPNRYKNVRNHNNSIYDIPGSACYTGSGSASGTLDCNEGNLDVQYIMGLAQEVSTIYWYEDTSKLQDPFLALVTDLFSANMKSTTVSISYGSIEQVSLHR